MSKIYNPFEYKYFNNEAHRGWTFQTQAQHNGAQNDAQGYII